MTKDNNKSIIKTDKAKLLAKIKKSSASISKTDDKKSSLIRAINKQEKPKLLFTLDATASRETAWNVAKEITGQMFDNIPTDLKIGLGYHSAGQLQEITPFSDKERLFKAKLNQIRCLAGGTALLEILEAAMNIKGLKAIVYIGDCFEENEEYAEFLAKQLKLRGVRLFIFYDESSIEEGYDHKPAKRVFPKITKLTSGALFPFDINSPRIIAELLKAITILAGEGLKALEACKDRQSQKLLEAVKE